MSSERVEAILKEAQKMIDEIVGGKMTIIGEIDPLPNPNENRKMIDEYLRPFVEEGFRVECVRNYELVIDNGTLRLGFKRPMDGTEFTLSNILSSGGYNSFSDKNVKMFEEVLNRIKQKPKEKLISEYDAFYSELEKMTHWGDSKKIILEEVFAKAEMQGSFFERIKFADVTIARGEFYREDGLRFGYGIVIDNGRAQSKIFSKNKNNERLVWDYGGGHVSYRKDGKMVLPEEQWLDYYNLDSSLSIKGIERFEKEFKEAKDFVREFLKDKINAETFERMFGGEYTEKVQAAKASVFAKLTEKPDTSIDEMAQDLVKQFPNELDLDNAKKLAKDLMEVKKMCDGMNDMTEVKNALDWKIVEDLVKKHRTSGENLQKIEKGIELDAIKYFSKR